MSPEREAVNSTSPAEEKLLSHTIGLRGLCSWATRYGPTPFSERSCGILSGVLGGVR